MNDIITLPSGLQFYRKRFSEYSDKEISNTIQECTNISHILNTLKLNSSYHHKIKKFIYDNNISSTHFKINYRKLGPIKDLHLSNIGLKKHLIKDKYLIEECNFCKIGTSWNGKSLTLQLDHINGNRYDNSIENLRLLCPNCHSQTETYAGRNLRKNTKSTAIKLKKVYIQQNIDTDETTNKIICNGVCCVKCNINISKRSKSHMCLKCFRYSSRLVERPPYKILIEDINSTGVLPTSRKYGVSNTTILKWIKNYEKNGV